MSNKSNDVYLETSMESIIEFQKEQVKLNKLLVERIEALEERAGHIETAIA